MELAVDPATLDGLVGPLTQVQQALVAARNATGHIPYKYQLEVALALEKSQDVLCIAGTGCGKSLAFVLILFMHPDWIVWIVSPLNVIEDQMADVYCKWGFEATSVNASTLTPKLLQEIKSGKYSVVIASPEAYHDSNKLRPILFSKELAHRRQITIVDEAHCITTWGETGFRKVYERIGDMRVFMPDPENSPICAATATCSEPVRHAIIKCLQLNEGFKDINLGNWRPNLQYGLYVLDGGQQAYVEVTRFFDPAAQPFDQLPQALIFVETYLPGYHIAYYLRLHFELTGDAAIEGIAVYHSLLGERTKWYLEQQFRLGKIRILIATEALTMGADFPNIWLVLTFLAPQTLEAWVQRAGRGARSLLITCLCIMIVTKTIVEKAVKACKRAGIAVDPTLAVMKAETADQAEEEMLAQPQAVDATLDEVPTTSQAPKKVKGQRAMNIGVCEYIATQHCRTAVLDREFRNPPHASCYDVGGCDRCVKRRQHDEDAKRHMHERHALKAEAEDQNIDDFGETQRRKQPGPAKHDNERFRYGNAKACFAEALAVWREAKASELSELYDLPEYQIMTDTELDNIAKTRAITDATHFDQPEVQWPGRLEWRTEVLGVLAQVQAAVDQEAQEQERQKQERERARAQAAEERALQLTQQRIEKEERQQEQAAERARKKTQAAQAKVERDQKAMNRSTQKKGKAAASTATIKQMEDASGGRFLTFSLDPAQTTYSPARAVGTMLVGPSGIVLPSAASTSSAVLSTVVATAHPVTHGSSGIGEGSKPVSDSQSGQMVQDESESVPYNSHRL